jgi:hypothetical protein
MTTALNPTAPSPNGLSLDCQFDVEKKAAGLTLSAPLTTT